MGLLLSRHDAFLTSEKNLERCKTLTSRITIRRSKRKQTWGVYSSRLLRAAFITLALCIAWVAYLKQVTARSYSTTKYLSRTATPFLIPMLLYLGSQAIKWLVLYAHKGEEKQLKKLDDAKTRVIKDLKDSTNFEKIMALLKKYDPAYASEQAAVKASTPGARQRYGSGDGALVPLPLTPGSANIASGLLTTALDSVSKFATKVIGDDPHLLDLLCKAHAEATGLKQENEALRQCIEQLCRKHNEPMPFTSKRQVQEGRRLMPAISVGDSKESRTEPLLLFTGPDSEACTTSATADVSTSGVSDGGDKAITMMSAFDDPVVTVAAGSLGGGKGSKVESSLPHSEAPAPAEASTANRGGRKAI